MKKTQTATIKWSVFNNDRDSFRYDTQNEESISYFYLRNLCNSIDSEQWHFCFIQNTYVIVLF